MRGVAVAASRPASLPAAKANMNSLEGTTSATSKRQSRAWIRLGIGVLLPVALLAAASAWQVVGGQQLQQHHHEPVLRIGRRPDSSSSLFADIEDLADASVRTRAGNLNADISVAQAQEAQQPKFEQLVERLLEASRIVAGSAPRYPYAIQADPNNKTSMRFVRNSKTFASIVYTNSKPRRLINCHLVDLERHSSDVALFEAKYGIKTMDVDFRDMMQTIDSCTNIARVLRPPRPHASPSANETSLASSDGAQRAPVLVVGRPASLPSPHSGQSVSVYQALMGSALNRELQSLGPSTHDKSSSRLELPGERRARRSGPLQPLVQLVVGEVTPGPARQASGRPGFREALQEITSYDSTDLLAIWRGILPGTNWCGMGDRATSYNDLGFEADIDICCRAHDFCPVRLGAFSSGYGLFNWSFYTRSHCSCDQNFLDCLERADSPVASVVMRLYFNVMKTTCLHDNDTTSAALYGTTGRPATPLPASGAHPVQLHANRGAGPEHRRRLLESIRANLPIPALGQSRLVRMRTEEAGKPSSVSG